METLNKRLTSVAASFVSDDLVKSMDTMCIPADGDVSSEIDGRLLYLWGKAMGDPSAKVALWLYTGAPAGIEVPFELDGILEKAPEGTPVSIDDLVVDEQNFSNHGDFDCNPESLEYIRTLHQNGWLKEFESAEAVEKYVGGKFVLSKFARLETRKWSDIENSWKGS